MTYYERVDELRDGANFTAENYETEYLTAEIVLVDLFSEYIKGAEIISKQYGTGKVVGASGDALDKMLMEVAFADCTKKLGVMQVLTCTLFNKFADISEIGDAWDHAFDLHTDMTKQVNAFKNAEREQANADAKKAEEEKKNEEKYQKQRAKALRDFETRTQTLSSVNPTDEFYYSLGWLAKHAGAVSAVLPDYLADAFVKHFGNETPCRIVDSRKRSPAGWQQQWSWSFTAALKKPGVIPALIAQHLNTTGNKVSDTSFIWDLVDNYGFQFGKTQDIEKIRSHVPAGCLASFEAGLA